MEPASGIEPPAYGLRNRSNTDVDDTSIPLQGKEPDDLEEDSQ